MMKVTFSLSLGVGWRCHFSHVGNKIITKYVVFGVHHVFEGVHCVVVEVHCDVASCKFSFSCC